MRHYYKLTKTRIKYMTHFTYISKANDVVCGIIFFFLFFILSSNKRPPIPVGQMEIRQGPVDITQKTEDNWRNMFLDYDLIIEHNKNK